MNITTNDPSGCHDLMYEALEKYKKAHRGPFVPFSEEETFKILQCEHCKAYLQIEYTEARCIETIIFSKRYCDPEERHNS